MRICLLECGDRGTGTLGRRAQTRPDRASCRVLECSAIRSVRPSAWLRRQERLRRVKPSTNALLAFGGMTSTGGDGAEECFFERAPDRAVAGTIDNAEFYDLVLQPSKMGGIAGIARGLRLNTASKPSSTSCLRTR